jgi:hypothetical protein
MTAMLLAAVSAHAASIAPHRAVYDLSLLRANEGASLQSATGRLAFEVDGSSCEGYTVNFRMATKYRPKEGDTTVVDTVTTSYEGPGATEFRHQLKESLNGEPKQDVKVSMNRPASDAEGEVRVSGQTAENITAPAGANLPMQHQLKLMALGERGGGRDSSVVFDGSDQGKSFRAISFVGQEKPAGKIARDMGSPAAAPLKALKAWPMTISYFPLTGEAETPEYQVTFDLYENGVATGLVLDYGEFVLSGSLTDLKMLEASQCP